MKERMQNASSVAESPAPRLKDFLTQCATSIAACWELSRSTQHSDLMIAFTGVSTYLPILIAIITDASQYRKQAAGLVFQALQLKARMAYHLEGFKQATSYAEQAVTYAEESSNRTMQVMALRELASAYEWETNLRREQALQVTEKARYLIEYGHGPDVPVQIQSWVYAGLAKYQALNGKSREIPATLEKAHETLAASSEDEPIPGFLNHSQVHLIRYQGMTYAYLGQQDKALECFSRLIDLEHEHIAAKIPMAARTRLAIISEATFASLKLPQAKKDKALSIKLWRAGMEQTNTLQSETYFSESYLAHRIMEALWSDDSEVTDLSDLLKHW